ncbi:hypothetical protein ACMXYX_18165 (plasmid) [Neptuniibacter sp. QD72_48]|uniref:hypothetical protein n=1 Tax=Neptuniibacter sp. QD72_48 TaxID=3398214 RepID=UPI0039F49EDD
MSGYVRESGLKINDDAIYQSLIGKHIKQCSENADYIGLNKEETRKNVSLLLGEDHEQIEKEILEDVNAEDIWEAFDNPEVLAEAVNNAITDITAEVFSSNEIYLSLSSKEIEMVKNDFCYPEVNQQEIEMAQGIMEKGIPVSDHFTNNLVAEIKLAVGEHAYQQGIDISVNQEVAPRDIEEEPKRSRHFDDGYSL